MGFHHMPATHIFSGKVLIIFSYFISKLYEQLLILCLVRTQLEGDSWDCIDDPQILNLIPDYDERKDFCIDYILRKLLN